MIAYITGSGFYEMPGFDEVRVTTRWGEVTLLQGKNRKGEKTLLLPRHGKGHTHLPHHIHHPANILALAECGATSIISLSICGVLHNEIPLASPVVIEDIYFPENRLGDGSPCTMFHEAGAEDRGHLLAESLIHGPLRDSISKVLNNGKNPIPRGTYAHVIGPRFNTKTEIRALRSVGADVLSQTCGPEAVLANELELPYALVGFTVDYANGVKKNPTPITVLQENMERAKSCFLQLVNELERPSSPWKFENFVYRFAP